MQINMFWPTIVEPGDSNLARSTSHTASHREAGPWNLESGAAALSATSGAPQTSGYIELRKLELLTCCNEKQGIQMLYAQCLY